MAQTVGEIRNHQDTIRAVRSISEALDNVHNDARKTDATLEAIADHLGEIQGTLQRIARALEAREP